MTGISKSTLIRAKRNENQSKLDKIFESEISDHK